MLHDALQQPLLNQLFPFYVLFEAGEDGSVIETGPAVKKIFSRSITASKFCHCFKITRPSGAVSCHEFFQNHLDSVLFVSCLDTNARLRGQVVPVENAYYLFVGSLLITEAGAIDANGLKISDFAPHDTTPDIVILHRFRELQVSDLERKSAALKLALDERDRYSEEAAKDPLTGLNNRRAFWAQCEPIIEEIEYRQSAVVLAIDLDEFKQINDEYGHRAGDVVLKEVSRRLRKSVRSGDVVGRIGGDEFAILLNGGAIDEVYGITNRLFHVLTRPFDHEGVSYKMRASIGAVVASKVDSLDQLISDADIAMYNGKVVHADKPTWYTAEMRALHRERKRLTQDLYTALKLDGIQQAYQPIIDFSTGEISAFEVLARWQHPEQGNITPDKFIDIAQQAGIVPLLDKSMLTAALIALRNWHAMGHRIGVQVNLSGLSVTPDFPEFVVEQLEKYQIPACYLTLELTETWFVRNEKELGLIFSELVELGVNLHLDDFGTGFSSLSHLQSIPINGLKIDRSFVSKALNDKRSRQLIEATLAITRLLDLEVVAEGIETQEQSSLIQSLGCDYGQGYLFSKPLRLEQATELLAADFKLAV